MRTIIIDTNALLRFLLNDIHSQKKATEQLLIKAKQKEITVYIVQAVIFEIDFTLRKYYQYEKEIVIGHLEPLISTDYLIIESREIFHEAIRLYKQNSISFVDCFLLAKSQLEGAELFTFDQKLQKLQKKI